MAFSSEEGEAEVVEKGPCEQCGSWKGRVLYSDGHYFCFACPPDQAYTPPPGGSASSPASPRKTLPVSKALAETRQEIADLLEGSDIRSIRDWGITQATCRYADYRVKAVSSDKGYHLAVYKDDRGEPCFVKVRVVSPDDNKVDFFGVGDQSRVSLLGAEKLGNGGKMVVVAEGEKDYLTGLQLWGCRFPVVGLPFGAESSHAAFAKALEKLSRYDQVVLALDMDKPGRDGALELARMLPPGKAFIAEFPEKDLHETFAKHGLDAAKRALFNAAPYAPDGFVDADEVDAALDEAPQWGDSLPFPELYEWTYGLNPGQIWVGGAGTSAGKSDWSAQIVAHHIKPVADGGNGKSAALFNYESDQTDTLRTILSKLKGHNFSVPPPLDPSIPNMYWTDEQLDEARSYRREQCAKLFINDHKGLVTWEAIRDRIRYLHFAYGVGLFVVDPVAALVAHEADKVTALDRIFAEGKGLAEELDVTILFWSHLTRPDKDSLSHEEGGHVEVRQMRGSNSIGMWADVIIGIERNQQAEDENERCTAICRMLKVRRAGRNTGKTFARTYNALTGILEPQATLPSVEDQDDTSEEDLLPKE